MKSSYLLWFNIDTVFLVVTLEQIIENQGKN